MIPDIHEECTAGELIVRAIERGGDKIAFITDGVKTTYREFGDEVAALVSTLKSKGIVAGTGVGCLSSNSTNAYAVTAAALVMGLRMTTLHPFGSIADQVFVLNDAEVDVLLFDPLSYSERATEISARIGRSIAIYSLGPSREFADILSECRGAQSCLLISTGEAGDVCSIVYTGGTTGRPKGVVHTHRCQVAMAMAELAEWDWPETTNFLAITPISHGAGACILPVLMRSGTVVLANGFTPEKFCDLIADHGVTCTFMVPTMIYKLLDYLQSSDANISTLKSVIYGGAPISPARLKEALEALGPIFMQLYGQTEAPVCVTALRRTDHVDFGDSQRIRSCGRPIYSNQVKILSQDGVEVDQGDVGELCVRGPLVMKEYWKRPDETAAALRGGWLWTGDLARRDADGYIYIVGRSKDMIISGGFNVYPAEIEDVLTSHPAVDSAAVIGVDDETWGETVVALVVLRDGHTAPPDDLVNLVKRTKGPVYAPKRIEFVASIPLTPLGKPDKKAIRAGRCE